MSCLMAALSVLVLDLHTYHSFERTRVRIIPPPMPPGIGALTVPLPGNVARLSHQPVALIVRARGAGHGSAIEIRLDGRAVASFTARADREVRIDRALAAFSDPPQTLSFHGTGAGWAVSYVELANVHGYSSGLLSFVVAPVIRERHRAVSVWLSVVLFLFLAAARPRLPQSSRLHPWYLAVSSLVLATFLAVLAAPFVSPYRVLVSLQAWGIGLLVLYAEPAVRLGRAAWATRPTRTSARPPWWVNALDALCLLVLALLVRALTGDGYQLVLPGMPHLTSTSWPRVAGWLGILLVARHFLWRGASWPARLAKLLRPVLSSEALRAAWGPFVVSRTVVLVTAYLAVVTFGFADGRPWRAHDNDWIDLFGRWDAGWYHTIASDGYPDGFNPQRTSAIAFFPALPLLMRGVSVALDVDLWIAGVLLVTVAFLWALTYLYRFALAEMSPEHARATVLLLAFYPFAFCYSAVLTEAIFLLASLGAFYHFRRHELWKAAVFGLLAGLLRPNGCLLSVPLAILAVLPFARGRGWLPRSSAPRVEWSRLALQLAAASAPGIGMLAYAAYIGALTGDPFAWASAQQAWGRAATEGFEMLEARRLLIATQGFGAYVEAYPIEIVEAAAAAFALAAVGPITRRFGLAYGVYVAICVLPPLVSMGSVSLGRYTAPLFPLFLWLGATIPAGRRPYWIAAFASGQALLAALFFTWRPPY